MKLRISTIWVLGLFMCLLPASACYSKPSQNPEPGMWQWLFGQNDTQKTEPKETIVCPPTLRELLCLILQTANTCCTDLSKRIDEILAKFPCNGFTAIDSIPAGGLTIDTPGKYCVTADLTFAESGIAITIDSDNVFLDFDFHSLTLTGTLSTGILTANRSNIVINNPVIHLQAATEQGILINGTQNCLIHRPLIDTNSLQTTGIALSNAGTIVITDASIRGTSICIVINFCTNIHLVGGNLSNSVEGVQYQDSNNCRMLNTTIQSTDQAVHIVNFSNLFINNCILKGKFAIDIFTSNNIFIENSQILGTSSGVFIVSNTSGNLGLFLNQCLVSTTRAPNGSVGIILFSDYNTIQNCIISDNDTGIQIAANAVGNAIVGCTVRNNNVALENNAGASTVIRGSNFFANGILATLNGATTPTPDDNLIF